MTKLEEFNQQCESRLNALVRERDGTPSPIARERLNGKIEGLMFTQRYANKIWKEEETVTDKGSPLRDARPCPVHGCSSIDRTTGRCKLPSCAIPR
jgi:hypothetical protein